MTEPIAYSAAQAIMLAKGLLDTFGWPAYSPFQALHAVEKKMAKGDPQISLMWAIAVRVAVERRKAYSGLHPVVELHVQEGQTKEGIADFFLDCIDRAENHPLNGATHAPPPP